MAQTRPCNLFVLRILSLLTVVLWIEVGLCSAMEIRGPYLTDLKPDQAVILLHTSEDADLVLDCSEESDKIPIIRKKSSIAKHHLFHLQGLKPGSRYIYRISSGGKSGASSLRTNSYSFTTPVEHPASFSFIVYGDSRDQSPIPRRHRLIAKQFRKHNPKFIISTGDLLTGGQSGSSSFFDHDWSANFFLPLEGTIESIPYHLVVGNHDQDAPDASAALKIAFPNLDESFNYSFKYGDAQLIVLHVANQMQEFQAQKQWFIEELEKAKDTDWRIVFLHVSPFTNGKYRESDWTLEGRQEFLETCVKNRVDLVFSGHDHSYQRFHPIRSAEDDSNSVQFVVTALSGTNPYHADKDRFMAKVVNKTDHFCVVDVSSKSLKITAYDNRNIPFDTFELPKTGRETGMVWKPASSSERKIPTK